MVIPDELHWQQGCSSVHSSSPRPRGIRQLPVLQTSSWPNTTYSLAFMTKPAWSLTLAVSGSRGCPTVR